jgi:hypothetical protein
MALSACGSESSSTPSETTAAVTKKDGGASTAGDRAPSASRAGQKQSAKQGVDNSIQEYGKEVSGSDLAAAAASLHAFLDARADRAWAAACEQLSAGMAEQIVQQLGSSAAGKADCASVLANLTAAVPDSGLREAAVADVSAFRVDGEHGFILYRGADGGYFMPMAREGNRWKVAAISASFLP